MSLPHAAPLSPAAPLPTRPSSAPRLRPVAVSPRPRRRPRLAYALLALSGALAIGAAQIGLSVAITQDSFTLATLNSERHELQLQTRALQDQLAGLSSPQLLAARASALGMVVTGSASYLRLGDAAVLGANTAAGATSTVDPTGSGAVHNAVIAAHPFLHPPAAPVDDAPSSDAPVHEGEGPQLPPALSDGLPSPTTR